jgi:hypothetical protein
MIRKLSASAGSAASLNCKSIVIAIVALLAGAGMLPIQAAWASLGCSGRPVVEPAMLMKGLASPRIAAPTRLASAGTAAAA